MARNLYYREKAVLYGRDKSKTWMLINEISRRKRKKNTTIKCIRDKEGNLEKDPSKLPDIFNKHFAEIGKNMASNFDNPSPENGLKDPLKYLADNVNHSMFLCDTNQGEILTLISKLETHKACGYDLITNKILKNTSFVIAPFLVSLFNECMKQGIFPDVYKIAKVIPLFKGGDKEDMNCYRPISLQPSIGKLFEKVISSRIISYLDQFNLLSPHQFGFRAKFSTEHAVLDIYEKMLKNLDSGLTRCAIFLDLAKAFD